MLCFDFCFDFDFKKNIFDPNYFKMSLEKELQHRSDNKCELCGSEENLSVFEVPNSPTDVADTSILICETCKDQIEDPEKVDPNHWRCLNDSMWSEHDAVKVVAWRMLNRLKSEGWPQDLSRWLQDGPETPHTIS